MLQLLIHAGATEAKSLEDAEDVRAALESVLRSAFPLLKREGARAAVIRAVSLLEDNARFNAGTGSCLQRDGKARLSAALMDSRSLTFSGVINIEDVAHPIAVADRLAREEHPVLAGPEALDYARKHGFPFHNPVTEQRRKQWERSVAPGTGTVGAVALDETGALCAGTSTGGIGMEIPGRVSDSATVAGNYASRRAAVSCTGRGEHIVNHGAAVRLASRIEDGMDLESAVKRTIAEADALAYRYGFIAMDGGGRWMSAATVSHRVLHGFTDGDRWSVEV